MTHTDQLILRKAQPSDCRFVWETNNHPSVRDQAIHTEEIRWKDHQSWFAKTLEDSNRLLLIVEYQDQRSGVLRFDIEPSVREATITIAIGPESRGVGLGKRAITQGSKHILTRSNIERVIAYIRPDNEISLHAFSKCGFQKAGEEVISGMTLKRFELTGDVHVS